MLQFVCHLQQNTLDSIDMCIAAAEFVM